MFMTQRSKWASDPQMSLNGVEIVEQSPGLLRRRSMLLVLLRWRAGGKNRGGENALLLLMRGFFYFCFGYGLGDVLGWIWQLLS